MTDTLKYGPQTAEVEALLARVRTLTDAEVLALGVARYAVRYSKWSKAWNSAWNSAWVSTSVWNEPREEAWVEVRNAKPGAVQDAMLALVARDLITHSFGFTQDHYDLLTEPWRRVIGKVHPDDEGMK